MSVTLRGPEHGRHQAQPDLGRRRFLGYLVAAPTLAVAVKLGWDAMTPGIANASIPSNPLLAEGYDLGDVQNSAALPTAHLIEVVVNTDGTVSFAMPRTEVGQGMTTSCAMLIAEELDIAVSQVIVTLADARPELMANQLTGGSNSMRSLFIPVRTAAAIAKDRMKQTAAARWNVPVEEVTTSDGMVRHRTAGAAGYGSLTQDSAVSRLTETSVLLKQPADFTVIGQSYNRIDALDAVTGRKQFAMDMDVPNALPTMVARPPTVKGTPVEILNRAEIMAMPGVTDVVAITYGVAVRAQAFGQCLDAIRMANVTWADGPVADQSDETTLEAMRAAQPPLLAAGLPLGEAIDQEFVFWAGSNAALEPDCAIADVRADRAEIWACLKVPITAKEDIATFLGLPKDNVAVHVLTGGGSFGRHLFPDAALEAAEASQKMGKPVKLMWTRADAARQGRIHPMCVSHVRTTYSGENVLNYEQRHASISTDFSHGFGEMFSMAAVRGELPGGVLFGNDRTADGIFALSQTSPYEFGPTDWLLAEVGLRFNTGSGRNIYSPNTVTAQELVVDQLAAKMGKDPAEFRQEFLRVERLKRVLARAVDEGDWGRSMPEGTAQGIAVHSEYQAHICCLVEIDCRDETVNRKIRNAVTGPRVTKVLIVVDPGLVVNPRGFEAQMLGGMNDGIAQVLTASLHVRDGLPLEASWDNYFYTRQWNTPLDAKVIIDPIGNDVPSGAGELAVAPVAAAVACAYARATGTLPTTFPINHDTLGFDPYPAQPSALESPRDGLEQY